MDNLTLVIPAKEESESLPTVLREVDHLKCKKIVILEKNDFRTINSIKNFNCKLIFQKKNGYGAAVIEGINNVQTEYLCIYNSDGSFDPKFLIQKLNLCKNKDFIFSSRYLKNGKSDDDTIVTKIGNYIFSMLGKIFFSLKISDILFTYVMGKTQSFKSLNLKCLDFCLCVEIPIKAERMRLSLLDIQSHERKRIAGIKKVSEFKDGFKILIYMTKLFFKN